MVLGALACRRPGTPRVFVPVFSLYCYGEAVGLDTRGRFSASYGLVVSEVCLCFDLGLE